MKVVVIGATGRTAGHVIAQLRRRNDSVIAIFRDPTKQGQIEMTGSLPVIFDLARTSTEQLAVVMSGADAVVFAAGTRDHEDNVDEIDRDAAIKCADAAEHAGVARFVQISAMGARTGFPAGIDDKMTAYYEAKRAGDRYLMSTSLDWTVLEPGRLTDSAPIGKITIGSSLEKSGKISRADVAATVIAALDTRSSVGCALELLEGNLSIAEAFSTPPFLH